MKILIACEESQTITKAFRKKGHEAYSCDLQAESGGHPEWHIKGDALKEAYSSKYDLMIAHPPCTYLAVSGARWMYNKDGSRNKERWNNQLEALEFVQKLMNAPIDKIAVENPVSVISSQIRKPDQIIQPYHFGDEATKTTCLWLKGLPKLEPTKKVELTYITTKKGHRYTKGWYYTPRNSIDRSRTFPGIAKAMAEQWS